MTMIYTGTTISFQNNTKFHQAHLSHPSFTKIVEACKVGDYDRAASLVDLKAVISTAFKGSLAELRDSNVYYRGEIVHSVLARRIVEIVREGFDAEPLLLFLENLMSNPSKRAVDELYGFLEVSGLPITDDGHFLAYKSVKQNFTDHHTGTMDNSVGSTVTMERNTVDEDKDRTCSNGLHFAAYEYANNFGSQGKMVVVKINPRDVVAIPSDYKNQKGRCCSYLVVEEVERSDAKLVGKSFVDTGVIRTEVTKATLADLYPPKAVDRPLTIGDTVTLNAKGVKKWDNQSDGGLGVITDKGYGQFDLFVSWENGHDYYYKAKHLDLHVEPESPVDLPEEPKVTPVLPTYIPQENNYENESLWSKAIGFKGKNNQFPVDRDTRYTLLRMTDMKEYKGPFYFTNYDVKHDNLVFMGLLRKTDGSVHYVTVTDASKWIIQLA
jgi:hypothetical protein